MGVYGGQVKVLEDSHCRLYIDKLRFEARLEGSELINQISDDDFWGTVTSNEYLLGEQTCLSVNEDKTWLPGWPNS